MASTFMMKNTLLRVTKAGFPNQIASFYPPKVTRVCFTSASKNLNQYAREDAGGKEDAKAAERLREAKAVYENDREPEEVEKKYKETKHNAEDTAQNMKHKAQDTAQNMKNKAEEGASDAKENTKDNIDMAKKKTGEAAQDTKEWTKDTADRTAEKTKEGANKAAEAMNNVGEKAKETAKGAWETAKGTTQKIKETVVGKDEDDVMSVDDFKEKSIPPKRPGDARDQMHRGGP